MLLERFGLWDARGERAGAYSRGMLQRLALCRTLLHEPALLVLDEPFTALDAEGADLLDGQLAELHGVRTIVLSTHDPERVSSAGDRPAGARVSYLADVATLARKDLRLELRARDTLPAMLLFVVSTLVVFHFALPEGADEVAAQGLLWVALLFTALLGLARAWAPERESGALEGLVLAPCDRSAIWLGKAAAVFAFLSAVELVALPAFALFFGSVDAATDRRRRPRERGNLRGRHAARRDGRREPDARARAPAPLPAPRDPARRRRRRRQHLAGFGPLPGLSRAVRRDLLDTVLGVL